MSNLPHIEVDSSQPATHCIIWLHGLGADGNDFAPIVPELIFPKKDETRFIFPHAPSLPVTVNGGQVMPAWYDIFDMDVGRRIDTEQLRKSAVQIRNLIKKEQERGIAARNIILAGFSQGGAVAYETALSYPQTLGGLLILSGYFATADSIEYNPANASLPILIQHGTRDPIVDIGLAEKARTALIDLDYQVSYQTYSIEHTVCRPQIDAISQWLSKICQ